jgi:hypothetical protein
MTIIVPSAVAPVTYSPTVTFRSMPWARACKIALPKVVQQENALSDARKRRRAKLVALWVSRRTDDLLQAILAHGSDGSEANGVIANFKALLKDQQQYLLNFLRSL